MNDPTKIERQKNPVSGTSNYVVWIKRAEAEREAQVQVNALVASTAARHLDEGTWD